MLFFYKYSSGSGTVNRPSTDTGYIYWLDFYSGKLWTVPVGNVITSLVYSFSCEKISSSRPSLTHNFLARYSPIPVEFDLFLFEPVNPFSNTLDNSDGFIPQPLSSITSDIFTPLFCLYTSSLFSCLSKYLTEFCIIWDIINTSHFSSV